MAYETKDNTGSLFQNKEKKSDNHPDYSGSMRINGVDMWISGWRKTAGNGTQFLSLAFKRKDGTAERPEQFVKKAQEVFPGAQIDLNDEVPFAAEFR